MAHAQQQTRTLELTETGVATEGTATDEVVISISAGFNELKDETLAGVNLADVLREMMAGIEEEGLTPRVVRFTDTLDLGVIGLRGAKLSGSGISIGIQTRGTTLIHQEDLVPLSNLELFPQAPLIDLETFRAIGKNAARYAKGETPEPVPVANDPMARPKYQALAAVWHIKEMQYKDEDKEPMELEVSF
ncbi:propanediol/glycerol family dehydratase medium subunit [Natronorubrum aibiense]|uniref:Propanediol/glycerol family dehydratase medium subunit n=1 Tax=Natronorubrum aibiense TaxID=348826 RepID=A0A5P9P8W7_9EURY|nr:propanediol/glycerol family dehydratase medium subunit [Natronorubrum aibiense]QFU84589.1 propanediol/glycerol family dehydratase medium subunit [Natronorubrum aibiense]